MASPAQAPQNFNRTHPNHERAHPSGESVGQYHIPTSESADAPTNGRNTEKEKWSLGRKLAIGAGAIGATLAVIVGGGKVVGHQTADRITNGVDLSDIPSQTPISEEAATILGDLDGDNVLTQTEADLMSITDYSSIAPEIRVEHKAESLNQYLYTAFDSIQPFLTPEEKEVLYLPDLNKPREQWSDQDYLNLNALAVWLVSTQRNDTQEGQQSYAAISNPDKDSFDAIMEHIKDYPGEGIKNVYRAVATPLSGIELANTNIGLIELGPEGGRLVGHQKIGETDINYTLYSNWSDSKGNIMSTNEHTYGSLNDPELQELIRTKSGS